jgi:hemin uptake protein HemP
MRDLLGRASVGVNSTLGDLAMPGGKEPIDGGVPPLDETPAAEPTTSSAVRYMTSADIFGSATEVVIEHGHHRYRLKMTSRGGLILFK